MQFWLRWSLRLPPAVVLAGDAGCSTRVFRSAGFNVMLFPPSLPTGVLVRSFHASNGELGVQQEDVDVFLTTCETDQVKIFGWESWIINHRCNPRRAEPEPADGTWCGLIPMLDSDVPAVIGGEGDVNQMRSAISSLRLSAEIKPQWLPYVRFNFTLGE